MPCPAIQPSVQPRHRTWPLLILAVLLALGSSLVISACSGTHDAAPAASARPATPRLASIPNFRDIAGADAATVYRNRDGRALRRGVFYRADAITPDDADFARLAALDIRALYDLRTPGEIAKAPDRVPEGANYVNVNLLGVAEIDASMFSAPGIDVVSTMEEFERHMVTHSDIRTMLAQLLTTMAATDGAQVFHCSAGKDRTGWVAALLHVIAGVPENIIMEDYLLTNRYTQDKQAQMLRAMREEHGDALADTLAPLMGVQASFLRAGLDEAVTRYGSMENYITQGLGLDDNVLAALREKLLE